MILFVAGANLITSKMHQTANITILQHTEVLFSSEIMVNTKQNRKFDIKVEKMLDLQCCNNSCFHFLLESQL